MPLPQAHHRLTIAMGILVIVAGVLNDRAQVSPKPLSKDEIVRFLKGDVSPKRVAELARERGLNFELTPEVAEELRKAGAGDELLGALRELSLKPVQTPQRASPEALPKSETRPTDDFIGGLNFTDGQKAKIDQIYQNMKPRMDAVVKDGKLSPEQKDAMLEGYRRQERSEVFKVLTPEQQTEVRKKLGRELSLRPDQTSLMTYESGFTAAGLTLNGGAKINGTRLQLTDATETFRAASAFLDKRLDVRTFSTDFSFQLTHAKGDGFAFVIQNVGVNALGSAGGGLGYSRDVPYGEATAYIDKSVAVSFSIPSSFTCLVFSGSGICGAEGAQLELSSGISLRSEAVFKVHITYDGTTMKMAVTNASNSSQTFTTNWRVDIPRAIGADEAYVGFTGGTGSQTATEEILSWTLASGSPK
jgi:legume-like lectin family protein